MTNTDLFPDLPPPIAKALVARGFTELTAVQRAVVDAEHEGRDLRVSSQTGSGKTVAIGLALAAHFLEQPVETVKRRSGDSAAHPRALVIVPTRELAAQVREELRWLFAELPGATVEVVTGGTPIVRERIALSRRPAFVVGTPGRLLDHMRNDALACDAIEHVILDEADQMLDMGFKDELDAILEQLPEKRSSHLVSATFPHAVKALAGRFQKDPLTLEGTKLGDANPDIQHIAYTIRRHETYGALINVLLLAGDSRCLLFVNRRIDATELAEKLAADGFGAAPFSGELPQAQRTRTLAAFRSGLLPILVSTDVAARGIDVPEISAVIHVDPPKNPDSYVHRSGRTGRAGRAGRSILLIEGSESRKVGRMLQATRVPVEWQRVPGPESVQMALAEQARKLLFTRLEEAAPGEVQRMAAKQLLEERDPIEVVAALLEMAKPKPPCEPMNVVGLDPFNDDGRGRKGRNERERHDPRDARGGYGSRDGYAGKAGYAGKPGNGGPFERGDRGPREVHAGRSERPPRGERPPAGSFTPFTVSWGEQAGATTARLLAHICRRGELESRQIGAIRVFAKSSLVEVANDVADAFEARARKPDEQDPGILIERGKSERPWPAAGRPHATAKRHPDAENADRPFAHKPAHILAKKPAKKPPFKARKVPTDDGGETRPIVDRDVDHVAGEAGFQARPVRKSAPKHLRKPRADSDFKGPKGPKGSGTGYPKGASKGPSRPPFKSGSGAGPKGHRKSGPGGPPARGRR